MTHNVSAHKKSLQKTYMSLRSNTSPFSSCDLWRENEYFRNFENVAEKLDFLRKAALEWRLKGLTPPATSVSSVVMGTSRSFITGSSSFSFSSLGLLLSLRRGKELSSGTEDKFEAKLAFTLFFLIMDSRASAVGCKEEPFPDDMSWKSKWKDAFLTLEIMDRILYSVWKITEKVTF